MKIERELLWMVKILNSEYVRPRLPLRRVKSGCKRDFERVAGVPESDKNFRLFLDLLISEGVLEFHERRTIGAASAFVVNSGKMKARIKQNPLYRELTPLIISEETAIGAGL